MLKTLKVFVIYKDGSFLCEDHIVAFSCLILLLG